MQVLLLYLFVSHFTYQIVVMDVEYKDESKSVDAGPILLSEQIHDSEPAQEVDLDSHSDHQDIDEEKSSSV